MDITQILIGIGIICIIASFFVGNSSKSHAEDIEKISISLHQETHQLKKRVKALEEELMMGSAPVMRNAVRPAQQKPVHEIIVNQILSLHAQGFAVHEIAKRSSLQNEQVIAVLQSKGVSI